MFGNSSLPIFWWNDVLSFFFSWILFLCHNSLIRPLFPKCLHMFFCSNSQRCDARWMISIVPGFFPSFVATVDGVSHGWWKIRWRKRHISRRAEWRVVPDPGGGREAMTRVHRATVSRSVSQGVFPRIWKWQVIKARQIRTRNWRGW